MRKNALAVRSLKVATAIGVSPSASAILTTTKLLPQTVMRNVKRKALVGLIVWVAICEVCFFVAGRRYGCSLGLFSFD